MFADSRMLRGFSLVEQLFVIGVIGILIAILLPAMAVVRLHASRAACMSNLRQLLQAQMMYVSESGGYLTYPNWGSDRTSTDVWPTGWLYRQDGVHDPLQQDDVMTGALYPYLGTTRIYHCPLHLPEEYSANGTDRLTSYIMNGAVCGYGAVGRIDSVSGLMAPSWKITDWTRPSEQVLWWEADESGDGAAAWNDGGSKPNENQLPFRHGSGASIACFDGHVEWMDAIDYLLEAGSSGPNRLWCDPHSPTGGSAE